MEAAPEAARSGRGRKCLQPRPRSSREELPAPGWGNSRPSRVRAGQPHGLSPPQVWVGAPGGPSAAADPRPPARRGSPGGTYGRRAGSAGGRGPPRYIPRRWRRPAAEGPRIFSALLAPEGARDHTASPPRPRHLLLGAPSPTARHSSRSPNHWPRPLGHASRARSAAHSDSVPPPPRQAPPSRRNFPRQAPPLRSVPLVNSASPDPARTTPPSYQLQRVMGRNFRDLDGTQRRNAKFPTMHLVF